ncbi:AAA family ATPase [Niallia taxi]|uniref:AAA family ATPase n=1 Tax=Niallia taxi TaxID=2499688 RepID=UPI003982687B
MRIKTITIYGYGKLENITYNLDADLQVFYGENEAGKSTIMSFIHSVLFGFPSKVQTELRYEPKNQAKYGGKLTAWFPEHGMATIERVKGKAAGDVTVILENGRKGQEDLLGELLQRVDKGLYQSIFSFNLDGLQNIHGLKSEEIGRFLFSTGVIGSDLIARTDTELQKELDARFRPNGKKPVLNELLVSLKDAHQQLKNAEKTNEQYSGLLQRREELAQELEAEEDNAVSLKEDINKLESWLEAAPIVAQTELLESKEEKYADLTFPNAGMDRWDRIKDRILTVQSRIQHVQNKIKGLEDKDRQLQPNEELLAAAGEITEASGKMPVYEELQKRKNQLLNQLSLLEKEMEVLQAKLHVPITEEDISDINTSIFMKEQCANADALQKRLKASRLELDARLKEEQQQLESMERETAELKGRLLSEDKRKELKTQLKAAENISWHKEKLAILQRDIESVQKQLEANRKVHLAANMQFLFVLIMLIAIGLAGAAEQLLYLMLAALLGSIAAILFFFNRRKATKKERSELQRKAKELKRDKAGMREETGGFELPDAFSAKHALEKDNQARESYSLHLVKLEQQTKAYERILSGYESWEQQYREHQTVLAELGDTLRIPASLAYDYIYDAYLLLDEWKVKLKDKRAVIEEITAIETELELIEARISKQYEKFFSFKADSLAQMSIQLMNAVKKENERKIYWQENNRALEECRQELHGLAGELSVFSAETEALLDIAEVKTEEEYRKKGEVYAEKIELEQKLSTLKQKLEHFRLTQEEIEFLRTIDEPEQEQLLLTERLAETKERIKQIMKASAENQLTISQAESGGTYTEKLHHFKQLQDEFQEEVKIWGKFAAAKHFLTQTVNVYKDKQLPVMLHKAEEYFAILTDNQYVRILPKEEGIGFLVEREDNTFFEAKELSRGTAEQLYVALRLALTQTFYQKYPLPIIIDDSFVNFDNKRTKKVLELLKTCRNNQLLFFTCHTHLLEHFPDGQIHSLLLPSLERDR